MRHAILPRVRWAPTFFRKSSLFWPIARAAASLESFAEWPSPADLTATFAAIAPIHFALAAPKRRRERTPAEARYDAQIAVSGRVPTRARSWHDLLNALVWATFPEAKSALHARQHRIIAARLGDDLRLPGDRTKEQDAIAMLDEGGVALLASRARSADVKRAIASDSATDLAHLIATRNASVLVFGHGIYESIVCDGPPSVRAATYVIEVDDVPGDALSRIRAADRPLAVLLARAGEIGRGDFTSIVVDAQIADATAEASRGE